MTTNKPLEIEIVAKFGTTDVDVNCHVTRRVHTHGSASATTTESVMDTEAAAELLNAVKPELKKMQPGFENTTVTFFTRSECLPGQKGGLNGVEVFIEKTDTPTSAHLYVKVDDQGKAVPGSGTQGLQASHANATLSIKDGADRPSLVTSVQNNRAPMDRVCEIMHSFK